jgi:hypothetical protein
MVTKAIVLHGGIGREERKEERKTTTAGKYIVKPSIALHTLLI